MLKLRMEVNKMSDEKSGDESLGRSVGKIVHYYDKLSVGIIELTGAVKVDDKIKIKGHSTDIEQMVDSIQINHADVQEAKAGDVIGIKVNGHVREDDKVYAV